MGLPGQLAPYSWQALTYLAIARGKNKIDETTADYADKDAMEIRT